MIEYLYLNVKPACFCENASFLTCTCQRNLSVYSGLDNIFYLNLGFLNILSPTYVAYTFLRLNNQILILLTKTVFGLYYGYSKSKL